MSRLILTLIFTLTALWAPRCSASAGTFLSRQSKAPRFARVHARRHLEVEEHFRHVGAAWPVQNLFLRAFKRERVLEVWARGGADRGRVLVWSFPLCAGSGGLGPKRREGDAQIPEGIYRIERFNPWSRFHLSLGLNYPNPQDRARAGADNPGSDIFIHGDCVSIGCLAIEDDPIERLYLVSVLAHDGFNGSCL